jgi:hypothetical protein
MRKCVQSIALFILLGLLTPMAGSQDKPQPCLAPEEVKDPKFVPGQVWKYKNRDHEEASTLTILKVESLPTKGTIVHIRIDKVRLQNCAGGPDANFFAHVPIAREALERSVTTAVKQKKEGKVPDFHEAYTEWRKQCADVYRITVAEAVQEAEESFRKDLGCK